jgi:hypothetical protein
MPSEKSKLGLHKKAVFFALLGSRLLTGLYCLFSLDVFAIFLQTLYWAARYQAYRKQKFTF